MRTPPLSSRRRTLRLAANLAGSLAGCLLLAACETWFGESDAPPLPGTRVSVLEHARTLSPDPQTLNEPIVLPPIQRNPDWPQAGGSASHAMQNLAAGDIRDPAWTASIGSGTDDDRAQIASPVVADGRVFTVDTKNLVSAFDAASGKRLWRVDLTENEDDDDADSGGLAYADGRLFVTTGLRRVFALDAASGKRLWRRDVGYPVHVAPTVAAGRLFFVNLENQLRALNLSDGNDAWAPFQATAETARMSGGASPAVDGGLLVAPFSSGEVVALRTDNGRQVWADSLAPRRRTDELSALAQVRARPVLDQGRVYAISVGGIFAGFDTRTGQRLWDRDIGGLQGPWLAGRQLFQITADNQLICVAAETGRIHWVSQLPAFAKEKERKGPILWHGPILLRDRLFVVSSDGRMAAISPYDGQLIDKRRFDTGFSQPPIVADATVYLLDDDGVLAAYR